LLPGPLSPTLQEGLVRLGTWLPFAPAAAMLAHFAHVEVGEATARRRTEALGAAYVQLQLAEVARLEHEAPPSPAGPALQQVSVDGVMVPLQHGEWGEVKVVAIGTVEPPAAPTTEPAHATQLSYFARRAEADQFRWAALGELHRRGTFTAERVVGIADGAEWCQGFYGLHRPDAVRILDFTHAFEYLVAAAQTCFGPEPPAATDWLTTQRHELLTGDPAQVLAALAALPTAAAPDPTRARDAQATALGYLEARRDQIRYATFRAAGYPIGSGMVESANKLVVEARLKGPGMHWAPPSINPMVALRTLAGNDRWDEAWPALTGYVRQRARQTADQRRQRRRAAPAPPTAAPPAPTRPPAPAPSAAPRPKLVVNGRPTAQHPWRRRLLPPRTPAPAPPPKS